MGTGCHERCLCSEFISGILYRGGYIMWFYGRSFGLIEGGLFG